MWKMIIGQSIFQLVVITVLYFVGGEILNYDISIRDEKLQLDTVIFNAFVWMQIFNELNCRRLDNKFNVFVGIHRNLFFVAINAIMVALQIAIVFVGDRVFHIHPDGLNGPQWAISILIAAFSLPWGVAVRVFPDEWFGKCVAFVAPPFVVTYGFIARWCSKFGGLFKRSKKVDEEQQSGSESDDGKDDEKRTDSSRQMSVVVDPPADKA